jgi:hypothetical protein
MKFASLFEQLDPKSIALKLQQRLIDESDGLFDVELERWSPTHDSSDDGIELMITSPLGATNSLYVSPTADGLRITKSFGNSGFKGYGIDDEGIDKAVRLAVRYMLGTMWATDQHMTADILKPLKDQKRAIGVQGKWYKLKRVTRDLVGPGKLYCATLMHYSGSYRICWILKDFADNWQRTDAAATNVLTGERWKLPQMTRSLEFYELIELEPS